MGAGAVVQVVRASAIQAGGLPVVGGADDSGKKEDEREELVGSHGKSLEVVGFAKMNVLKARVCGLGKSDECAKEILREREEKERAV